MKLGIEEIVMRWLNPFALTITVLIAAAPPSAEAGKGRAPNRVTISAKDAAAKKLPAVDVSMDATGTFIVSRFPEKGVLLRLSGPPGGPLGASIRAYRGHLPGKKAALALLKAHVKGKPFALGKLARIKVAGRYRWVVSYGVGRPPAASHGCLIMLEKKGAREGVILRFWASSGGKKPPSCTTLMGYDTFRPIFKTLKVQFR
jgi:hypothetical protein